VKIQLLGADWVDPGMCSSARITKRKPSFSITIISDLLV